MAASSGIPREEKLEEKKSEKKAAPKAPPKPKIEDVIADAEMARGWAIKAGATGVMLPSARFKYNESKQAKEFKALKEGLIRAVPEEKAAGFYKKFDEIDKNEKARAKSLLDANRAQYEELSKQLSADYVQLEVLAREANFLENERKKIQNLNAQQIQDGQFVELARQAKQYRESLFLQYQAAQFVGSNPGQNTPGEKWKRVADSSVTEHPCEAKGDYKVFRLDAGRHVSQEHDFVLSVSKTKDGRWSVGAEQPPTSLLWNALFVIPSPGNYWTPQEKYQYEYKKQWGAMIDKLNPGPEGVRMSRPPNHLTKQGDLLIKEVQWAFQVAQDKGVLFDPNGWIEALAQRGTTKPFLGCRFLNYSVDDLNTLERAIAGYNSQLKGMLNNEEKEAKDAAKSAVAREEGDRKYEKQLIETGRGEMKGATEAQCYEAGVSLEIKTNDSEFKKLKNAQAKVDRLLLDIAVTVSRVAPEDEKKRAGGRDSPEDVARENLDGKLDGAKKAIEELKTICDELKTKGTYETLKHHVELWNARQPPITGDLKGSIATFDAEIRKLNPATLEQSIANFNKITEALGQPTSVGAQCVGLPVDIAIMEAKLNEIAPMKDELEAKIAEFEDAGLPERIEELQKEALELVDKLSRYIQGEEVQEAYAHFKEIEASWQTIPATEEAKLMREAMNARLRDLKPTLDAAFQVGGIVLNNSNLAAAYKEKIEMARNAAKAGIDGEEEKKPAPRGPVV